MKTITVTFTNDSGIIGAITAEFPTLPGASGSVRISHLKDLIEKVAKPAGHSEFQIKYYAETFESNLRFMASQAGVLVTVSESGDWKVFFE